MGNRAVITTETKELGIYLHWNGGRDSVEAFLTVARLYHLRPPEQCCYGWARLCQIIGNYFSATNPDGLSLGIDLYSSLDTDNGDNGVYIIKNWRIIGREYAPRKEQRTHNHDEQVATILAAQPYKPDPLPAHDQLTPCQLGFIEGFLGWYSLKYSSDGHDLMVQFTKQTDPEIGWTLAPADQVREALKHFSEP